MISKKTKYAFKALITLAENYPANRPVLISDLAKKDGIPKKFLELILLEMKNSGILLSKKGKGGGYFLARSPSQIKLGSVMRLLEGPLAPLQCLSQTAYRKCDDCRDESTCAVRLVMKELRDSTVKILDGTSLQDMVDRNQQADNALAYAI